MTAECPNFLHQLEDELIAAKSKLADRNQKRRRWVGAAAVGAVIVLGLSQLLGDEPTSVTAIDPSPTTLTTPPPGGVNTSALPSTTNEVAERSPDDPAFLPLGPLETRGQTVQVWTGSELIVYGGNSGDDTPAFRTGGAYAPTAQTWRIIAEAPDQTGSTTGVWTGTELLVTSGTRTSFYDPALDTWRQTDGGVGPGQIIYLDTAYVMNDSGIFRYESEGWAALPQPPAQMQINRQVHTSQLLIHSDMLTVASVAEQYCTGRNVAQFDGSNWIELPYLELQPVAGDYADCSWANQIGVAGGRLIAWDSRNFQTMALDESLNEWVEIDTIPASSTESGSSGIALGDDLLVPQHPAAILDGDTLTWTAAELPGATVGSNMVWTGDRVLMWGDPCCYGTSNPLSTHSAWQWIPVGTKAGAPDGWVVEKVRGFQTREGATYATGDRWFFAWGGFPDRSADRPTSSLLVDIETRATLITPFSPPLEPRRNATSVWTGSEFIVFGGSDGEVNYANGGIFDPVKVTWRDMAASPMDPGSLPASTYGSGRMFVWTPESESDSAEPPTPKKGTGQFGSYSPASDTWTIFDPPPVSIIGAELILDGDQLLLVGGPPMRDIGTAAVFPPVQLASFDLVSETWTLIGEIQTTGESTRVMNLDGDLYLADSSGTAVPLDTSNPAIPIPTSGCWWDVATTSSASSTYLRACGAVYRFVNGGFDLILNESSPVSTGNTYGSGFVVADDGSLVMFGDNIRDPKDPFVAIFAG